MSLSPALTTPRLRGAVVALLTSVLLAMALVAAGPSTQAHAASITSAEAAAAARHPGLAKGSKGAAVRYLQKRLGVTATGNFYTLTYNAVRRFEKAKGLHVNGYVGRDVWRALGVTYRPAAKTTAATSSTASAKLRRVLAVAAAQRGKPYRYGAAGPSAFDCSGYVGYVYRKALGKQLPRTASAIKRVTRPVSRASVRPGDLVFTYRGGRISHVAIYAGGNYWWEASRPGRPVAKNKAWTSSVSYGRIV